MQKCVCGKKNFQLQIKILTHLFFFWIKINFYSWNSWNFITNDTDPIRFLSLNPHFCRLDTLYKFNGWERNWEAKKLQTEIVQRLKFPNKCRQTLWRTEWDTVWVCFRDQSTSGNSIHHNWGAKKLVNFKKRLNFQTGNMMDMVFHHRAAGTKSFTHRRWVKWRK